MTYLWRRRLLLAAIVLVPLAIIAWPLLLGHTLFAGDLLTYTYPLKLQVRRLLLAGELPLWNPQLGLGRPVLGMIQPGAFDPLNAFVLLPLPLGIDLFTVVHLPIAALGVRHWLRALAVTDPLATVGGALFAFSGPYLSLLAANGTYAWGFAFVPWFLSCCARAAVAPDRPAQQRLAVVAAGLLAWCVLAGDPMAVYFALLCAAPAALVVERSRRRAALLALAASALLGGALAAVQLLPAREVVATVRSSGIDFAEASHFALHPLRLLELIWPGCFGAPHTPAWFVHALYDEGTNQPYEPLLPGLYLGLGTPVLMLAALRRPSRTSADVALAAVVFTSLLVAFGRFTPLWSPFFHYFPGARLFRHSEKYALLASLGAVVLAARGLSGAFLDPARALRGAALGVIPLVLVALVAHTHGAAIAVALVGRLGPVPSVVAGAAVAEAAQHAAAVAALYALVLALIRQRAWSPERARLALALTILLDVTVASLPLVLWGRGDLHHLATDPGAMVRRLSRGDPAPARLYRASLLRLEQPGADLPWSNALTLKPNLGQGEGLAQIDPYDAVQMPRERRYAPVLRGRPVRLLQLTSTRFALLLDAQLAPGNGLRALVRYPDWGATLVEVPGVAPRAYVPRRVLPAASAAEAESALQRPDLNPAQEAVIEGASPGENDGSCTVERYRSSEVVVRCAARQAGWMVLTDGFFPGWSATVDGRPAAIAPANLALRAVRVPAGTSRVVMRYRPAGFVAGAALSLAALVAGVVALWRTRRRA